MLGCCYVIRSEIHTTLVVLGHLSNSFQVDFKSYVWRISESATENMSTERSTNDSMFGTK
jgi:hypothetical protein